MTWGGVVKSGSPTPRLMTSGIVASTSKNLRMPDGGTSRTRRASRERPAAPAAAPFPMGAEVGGVLACSTVIGIGAPACDGRPEYTGRAFVRAEGARSRHGLPERSPGMPHSATWLTRISNRCWGPARPSGPRLASTRWHSSASPSSRSWCSWPRSCSSASAPGSFLTGRACSATSCAGSTRCSAC